MNTQASSSPAEDRDAITAIIVDQSEAWNRADAVAFGQRFHEDGSFTNVSGLRIYGRAGFVSIHEHLFRSIFAGSRIAFVIDRLHFPNPEVAVVEVDATLTQLQQAPAGVTLASDGALHSKLQEVLTRDETGWTIVAFHNVAVAPGFQLGFDVKPLMTPS